VSLSIRAEGALTLSPPSRGRWPAEGGSEGVAAVRWPHSSVFAFLTFASLTFASLTFASLTFASLTFARTPALLLPPSPALRAGDTSLEREAIELAMLRIG